MSALILEDVYVQFPIFGSQPTLRKTLFSRTIGGLIGREDRRRNRVMVKALEAISLNLKDGDRLGLIGHNGAGKTTLLRVMAGIYEPVSGRVRASGKITPLLEVLPGLDGEDTGYDNIVSSGLMLGMSHSQIQDCIPDIEEFTELGEYLSLPVRTYSSGMLTRLGFALATAIEPDILLIDEGIGAGDQRFAERAEKRLDALIGRSRILVISSHSDVLIRQFCDKVALLQEGRIIAIGPVAEIVEQYHASAASAVNHLDVEADKDANGDQEEAMANALLGDVDTAIDQFAGVFQEKLERLEAANELAAALAEQGHAAAAADVALRGLVTGPNRELLESAVEYLVAAGRVSEIGSLAVGGAGIAEFEASQEPPISIVVETLEALLRTQNQHVALWATLGNLLSRQGDHVKAVAAMRRACSDGTGDVTHLLTLGQILAANGEFQSAADAFHGALALQPDSVAARDGLSNVTRHTLSC